MQAPPSYRTGAFWFRRQPYFFFFPLFFFAVFFFAAFFFAAI